MIDNDSNPYKAPQIDSSNNLESKRAILKKKYGVESDLPEQDIQLLFNLHQRNQVRSRRARKEKFGATLGGLSGATTSITAAAVKKFLLAQNMPVAAIPSSFDIWLTGILTLGGGKLGHSIASKKHKRLPIASNDLDFVDVAYRKTGRINSEALAESITKLFKKS